MRSASLITLICLTCIYIYPSACDAATIFWDDFNRPDGPLGPPWEVLDQSELQILNERAVANVGEYGLMVYAEHIGTAGWPEVLLSARFSYGDPGGSDWLNNRFQFFIIGSDPEQLDYWGFIGKIEGMTAELFTIEPETLIATGPASLSPDGVFTLLFSYDVSSSTASLLIRDETSAQVANVSASSVCGPLSALAIGIENLESGGREKWIDDVEFSNSVTAVEHWPMAGILSSWPQPFSSRLQLSASGSRGESSIAVIHDIQGRELRRISLRGGSGFWDGRDAAGRDLPSGVYLLRLQDDAGEKPIKVIKLR